MAGCNFLVRTFLPDVCAEFWTGRGWTATGTERNLRALWIKQTKYFLQTEHQHEMAERPFNVSRVKHQRLNKKQHI